MPRRRVKTAADKAEQAALKAAEDRSAAGHVCDYAIRHGCRGVREDCGAAHGEHAEVIRLYLMALRLMPDPATQWMPTAGHTKAARHRQEST
jgi:hypothetical protein